MADYTAFFLDNTADVIPLECIEISHPSFLNSFCYIKNATEGITAGGISYQYQPMSIKRSNVSNDLDQKLSLTIADMQDDLSQAIEKIFEGPYSKVPPRFNYRIFRDDDLSSPMIALQTLEITSMSKDSQGLVTFDAQAPELNTARTGLVYAVEDYPLLRGV